MRIYPSLRLPTDSIEETKIEIINLRDFLFLIPEYVELRNTYRDLLLTTLVSADITKEWLLKENVEVLCLLENNTLVGSVILFLSRKGEVAIFTKRKNEGFGTLLLQAIEIVAKKRGLKTIWAWVFVSNIIAQKLFIKNGYFYESLSEKIYQNMVYKGCIFRKNIVE